MKKGRYAAGILILTKHIVGHGAVRPLLACHFILCGSSGQKLTSRGRAGTERKIRGLQKFAVLVLFYCPTLAPCRPTER